MNWDNFFFAFSGASAALIGVVFAFVVSKLLNNISDFDNLSNETTELIIERQKILNDISSVAFFWHDKMVIKYDYQLKQKYNKKRVSLDKIIEQIETETNRRIFLVKESLEYIKSEIENYENENKKREITTPAFLEDGTKTTVKIRWPNPLDSFSEIPNENIWKEINSEEEKFESCYQKANIQIYKFKYVIDKIETKIKDFKIVKNIISAFVPITIFTVIYPLHFIPIAEDKVPQISFSIQNFFKLWFSLKGFLLTILFISTVGSMAYFIHLCSNHIKKYNEIKKMISIDFIDIKKYCELFSNG